jgi:hypothetical protein
MFVRPIMPQLRAILAGFFDNEKRGAKIISINLINAFLNK